MQLSTEQLLGHIDFDLSNFTREIIKRGKYDKQIAEIAKGDEQIAAAVYDLLETLCSELNEHICNQEQSIEETNQLIKGFVLGVSCVGNLPKQ